MAKTAQAETHPALDDRLRHPETRVRHVAVMDVRAAVRREGASETLAEMVTRRLAIETDERVLVVLCHAAREGRMMAARTTLEFLRDDARQPVAVYHAALLACDALEPCVGDEAERGGVAAR
jgi:hypothetical protein